MECDGQSDEVFDSKFGNKGAKNWGSHKRYSRMLTKLGKPELLITDGLQSYHKAFNKEFYDNT